MHKNHYSNTAYQIDGEPGYHGVGTVGGATASGPSCYIWTTHKPDAPVDETTQDASNCEPFFDEETGEPRFIVRCDTVAMATALTAKLNEDDSWIFPLAPASKTDFRALALQANANRIEAERIGANEQERADHDFRALHHRAARALIEDGLCGMCGALPPHEIEWNGSGHLVSAIVHLGDISLRASFHCQTAAMTPESVRFTYNAYYVTSLAELGKLIQEHEAQCSEDCDA